MRTEVREPCASGLWRLRTRLSMCGCCSRPLDQAGMAAQRRRARGGFEERWFGYREQGPRQLPREDT